MGAAILKLNKDRKLLNACVTWTQQFDRKPVEPVQSHVNKCEQRIIPEQNAIILLKLRHEWHTTISFRAGRNLRRERWLNMAEILMPKSNYNPGQSREGSCDVREFEFFLPAFESGFRCSRNDGPPVIWMIYIYLWLLSRIFLGYCSKHYILKKYFL